MTPVSPASGEVDVAAFWSKVEKTSTCWLWTGHLNHDGYGVLHIGNKNHRAHRISYALFVGEPDPSRVLDHICRERASVNPEHLREVTNRENVLAGIGTSAVNARKTRCMRGHDLMDPANVYIPPARPNERHCRECKRIRSFESHRRVRSAARAALTPSAPTEETQA